jgi:hypothetical protein
MHANSFAHNAQHARKDPFSQIMSLSAAFTAATVAELQLVRVRKITTDQIRSSMTVHSQGLGVYSGKYPMRIQVTCKAI